MNSRSESEHKYKISFRLRDKFLFSKTYSGRKNNFSTNSPNFSSTKLRNCTKFFSSRKFHFLRNSRGQEESLLITMMLVFCLKLSFSGLHSFLQNGLVLSIFLFLPVELLCTYNTVLTTLSLFCHQSSKVFAANKKLIMNLFFFLHR